MLEPRFRSLAPPSLNLVISSSSVKHYAIQCAWQERDNAIADVCQVYGGVHGKTMVFTATKKEADELCHGALSKMNAQAMHSDIAQFQVCAESTSLLVPATNSIV